MALCLQIDVISMEFSSMVVECVEIDVIVEVVLSIVKVVFCNNVVVVEGTDVDAFPGIVVEEGLVKANGIVEVALVVVMVVFCNNLVVEGMVAVVDVLLRVVVVVFCNNVVVVEGIDCSVFVVDVVEFGGVTVF